MLETVCSPLNGELVELDQVSDEVFSQKMLGDGVALIPHEKELYSPISGIINMVYETQHAIGITTELGTEILIHIGIDTVMLKGEPFNTKVKVGQVIENGDLLTEVDWSLIKEKGFDTIIPIIVLNKQIINKKTIGNVMVGNPLFEID